MKEETRTDTQSTVIPLWPDGAPGSEDWTQQEVEALIPPTLKVVRNVALPTLTAYLPVPAMATGTAVIVCPGGAFHFLSIDMEGTDVAHWLNGRGIAAFVLKYRLVRTGNDFPAEVWEALQDRDKMEERLVPLRPLILADGQQAVRIVRAHASEWGILPDRIGILGFSAGGVVAANVALQHDAGSRPDFAGVIYGGSRDAVPVPADAPPLFVLCAADDPMVPPHISVHLYEDWRAAGHSAELHVYAQGGHGFGMQVRGLPTDTWIERFADWLQAQGLFEPDSATR